MLKSSSPYYCIEAISFWVINVGSNNLFSVNRVGLWASNLSKQSKKEWKHGKKGKKKQHIQDGLLGRNNVQELVKDTQDKRPPPKTVDKRPPLATRDKRQFEIVEKGLAFITKDEWRPEIPDKELLLVRKDKRKLEIIDKRSPLATKEKKQHKTVNKRPLPANALPVPQENITEDNKKQQVNIIGDKKVPLAVVAYIRLFFSLLAFFSFLFFFI